MIFLKLETNRPSKHVNSYIILAIIIVFQLIWTSYVFVYQKQGVHSDEIWTYGLSNSYYQPYVQLNDGMFILDATPEDYKNLNEWVSGETLNDYVSVQEGERFAYGSVYHNQTLDCHPPLYYFIIHTICSFFPNTFSFYFAYILNCICLIFTQIFLFKLLKTLCKSERTALIGCLFYGASVGALNTVIFLRMYTMLTMLCVMYTYFNAKLYISKYFNLKKHLPPIAIISFLCFMTNYNGIAFIGVFTACFCIYLVCRKKIKEMFIYGGTILGTLGIYCLVYPAAVKHILRNKNGGFVLSYETQLRKYLSHGFQHTLGFQISVFKSDFKYKVFAIIFAIIVLSIPILFLLRKEKWFITVKKHISVLPRLILSKLKIANYIPLFIFVSVFVFYLVISNSADVFRMGIYSTRYIFMTFPFICGLVVIILERFIDIIPKIGKYSTLFCLIFVITISSATNINYPTRFLMEEFGNYQNTTKLFANKNCLIVTAYPKGKWHMNSYIPHLYKASNIFFTNSFELEECIDDINSLNDTIDYLIVDPACFELNDNEKDMVSQWQDQDIPETEIVDNDNIVDTLNGDMSKINSIVKQLNNGCEYEILFGINIQTACYYVLELK